MQIMTYIVPYSADKKYFQIQFGPVDYCLNWGVSYIIAIYMTPCMLFTEDSNNSLNLKNHGNRLEYMKGRDNDRVTCVTQ